MDLRPLVHILSDINLTMQNDNPYVVYGPEIMDGDDAPSEGLGIIISPVGIGATNFPGNPGSLYTLSLNANNILQIFTETNEDGFYWRLWDNVSSLWYSWHTLASESFAADLVDNYHTGERGGVDYWTGLNIDDDTTIRTGIVAGVAGSVGIYFDNSPGVIDGFKPFDFTIVGGGGILEVVPDNEAGWAKIQLTSGGILKVTREFGHYPNSPWSATVHYHYY